MTTTLNALVAAEHVADLRRAAQNRQTQDAEPASDLRHVTLRLAEPADAGALQKLAALDEAPELTGEALLASVDSQVVAALALTEGRVVANPFVASADAVSLLQLRARQLTGRTSRKPHRRWRPRLV